MPGVLSAVAVGSLTVVAGLIGLGVFKLGLGSGILTGVGIGLVVRHLWRPRSVDLMHGLAGGVVGGLTGASLGYLFSGPTMPTDGLGAALGTGLAVGMPVACTGGFASALVGGVVGGWTARLAEAFAGEQAVGWLSTAVNSVGVGIAAGLAVHVMGQREPVRGRRWSWLGCAVGAGAGVIMGVSVWLQAGFTAGLSVGEAGAVAGALVGGLGNKPPNRREQLLNPRTSLTEDRSTFRAVTIRFGLAVGLVAGVAIALEPRPSDGQPHGLVTGVLAGVALAIPVGLAVAFMSSAWGGFALARVWLALSGRLPWRLLRFLENAQGLQVLRDAGAHYEFRHARLQLYLRAPAP